MERWPEREIEARIDLGSENAADNDDGVNGDGARPIDMSGVPGFTKIFDSPKL